MPSFIIVFSVTSFVVINTLKESLGLIPELFLHDITLKYYVELLADKVFIKSLSFSIVIAFISAVLSTLFGTCLGYAVGKTKGEVINSTYKFPIFLSYIAAAALIYNTFSDHGLLYHIFFALGLNVDNLNIIYNPNGLAVVVLNVFKGIPFVAFSVAPIFSKNYSTYKETAKNLGCSSLMYIFKILLPLCKRAILASSLVLFNYNLFAYEGFYYLGPSNPPSIGVLAFQKYISSDISNRVVGMVINMIMIIISLILCVIYYKLIKSEKKEAL